MIDAAAALTRLKEGNVRYVSPDHPPSALTNPEQRHVLTNDQKPFAVILGCSDSRAPAELIFDQGLGDLFVVRVAGNVICPETMGSVEFACAKLGARLVVVLGHTSCGAVAATVDEVREPSGKLTPSLRSIVDDIRPCIAEVCASSPELSREELIAQGTQLNVAHSVNQLLSDSPLLEDLIEDDGLLITGALYDLKSGVVTF